MLQYISDRILLIIISTLSAAVNFAFAYAAVIRIMGKEKSVGLPRIIMGSLINAAIYVLPQFLVEFYVFDTVTLKKGTDSFFLFPNAFYVFPYYLILCKVMKLKKHQSKDALEDIVCAQYIILLLFRMYSSIWGEILPSGDRLETIFNVDGAAMLSVFVTTTLVIIGITAARATMKRSGRHVSEPLGAYGSRSFGQIFASVAAHHLMLFLFGLLVFGERRETIQYGDALIYFVLVLVFTLRLIENNRRRRIQIFRWNEDITNEYVNSLTIANTEMQGVRHDMNNIIQVYGAYIECGDMEGLQKYHKVTVDTTVKTFHKAELIASLSHRKAVFNTLSLKLKRGEQLSVRFEINGLEALGDAAVSDFDLCRVLGNLLDNAIDAASETDDPFVRIECIQSAGGVKMNISNPVRGKPEHIKIFEKGFSTKKGHSGLGLTTVKQILENYDGCFITTDSRNDLFVAGLTLRRAMVCKQ